MNLSDWLKNHKTKIILIIASIVIIFSLNLFQKPVRNFFYLISSPIQKILWKAGDNTSNFLSIIFKIKNLENENSQIKLKNLKLRAENIKLQALKKENQTLRQALEIGLEKEFKLILAKITSKTLAKDSILIDKGSIDNIEEPDVVINEQKVLCGKVIKVYKNFSEVALLSNKDISFDVTSKNIQGLAKGIGNSKILLDFIPQEADIREGDFAITSALGNIFPDQLLAGEIKKILKSDIEPFQKAEVKPACDIKEIEQVFIIKKH